MYVFSLTLKIYYLLKIREFASSLVMFKTQNLEHSSSLSALTSTAGLRIWNNWRWYNLYTVRCPQNTFPIMSDAIRLKVVWKSYLKLRYQFGYVGIVVAGTMMLNEQKWQTWKGDNNGWRSGVNAGIRVITLISSYNIPTSS